MLSQLTRILAVLYLSAAVAATVIPRAACPPLHIVAMRGLNDPQKPDWYSFLITPVKQILAAVPGSTSYGLPYDATKNFEVAALNGSLTLQSYIKDYIEDCPTSKIGILGYSDGAIAVSNALCGAEPPYAGVLPMDTAYTSNVVATVVWGDLTKPINQPFLQGTCPPTGLGITPRAEVETCGAWLNSYQNYCVIGDRFCCQPTTETGDAEHHSYAALYSTQTSDFIVNAYKKAI